MKPEYKNRAEEHLDAISKRIKVISQMLNGERPVNQEEAKKLANEIQRLVDLTLNIIYVS